MYLKYVEMQGFKSFPDKIRFQFGKGVTAIVGPNGSGKSNVSDAIKWVLGEISSKNLRGTKMEDVIFSGAQGRSPSSFAEVSLCMDNSDGGLNDEHEEVIVTRHFSRSGNSEYYINKKEVRLKDIFELFMDTGIGREGYSIIGQGQVGEILSAKSDARREMIDEAAGVSKYKHRKKDAVKNLSSTSENLVRLTDILGEVSSRVEPSRKEAEKTEKYLVLYEEARKLEVSMWLDEIDSLDGEKQKVQSAYDTAKKNLEICENEISDCERMTEEFRLKMQENNESIESSRDGIKNFEKHINELSERKSILANDIQHFTERLDELKTQYNELIGKIKVETQKFNSEYSKGQEFDEKKTNLERCIEKGEKDLEEFASKLYNIDFEIGNLALTKELSNDEITESKMSLSGIKAGIEQLKNRIAELTEGDELDNNDIETKKKYNEALDEKATREKTLSDVNLSISFANEKLEKLSSDNNTANEKLQDILVKKAELSKHIDMLNRMENMLEGYAFSVKAVMQAANSGKLSGIHGPVSKLISAPEKFAVALEVALGAQAQNIVTENEKAAKSGIAELKAARAGRATFLPLDTINGRAITASDVVNKNGYIGIASELVSFEHRYQCIVNYLLGRTIVAENIDSAAVIARSCGFKYKVVSLDGQVVNAGGSFTGGSLSSKTGILTRAADIEKLTAELDEVKKIELSTRSQLEKIQNERNELFEELNKNNDVKLRLQTGLAAIEAEISALGESMQSDDERRCARIAEIDRLNCELKEKCENLKATEEHIVELEDEQNKSETLYKKRKEDELSMQVERDELKNSLYSMKIELAEVIKDIENYQYSIVSMTQTLELDTDQSKSLEKQITEFTNKIKNSQTEIDSVSFELENGGNNYEKMQNTVKELDRENLEFQKKITECDTKLKKCYGEKENLVREYTKAEAKLENGQTEHDRIISRLFDTYDLTYTTAGEYRIVIENKGESTKRLSVLKGEIKKLGSVNLNAVSEYAELKERYDFLTKQVGDLTKSKEELEKIISDLDGEMKRILSEAMTSINENFGRIFKELFGGGKAEICFADNDDIIDGDVDIFAQPPGKNVNNIQLLSGGERSLISISLYFAMIAVSPTPFCIMDEIESALDDVNVDRFAQYAKHFCDKTQFIMITHRRGTMNVADILYGITMQEKGISKYLTISVDEVEQRLGIKL